MSAGPRQRFNSNLIAIKFGQKGGWSSVEIFLGNEGEGGTCNLFFSLTSGGTEFPLPSLGSDGVGNPDFWSLRGDHSSIVPAEMFNTKTDIGGGITLQNFGVQGFDSGDDHNGSAFFFKLIKPAQKTFTVHAFATAGTHSNPLASLWREEDFQNPFDFHATRAPLATNIFLGHTGNARFHFDTTKGHESITANE